METIRQFFERRGRKNKKGSRIPLHNKDEVYMATKKEWKWFKAYEIKGLIEDLVFKLDRARGLFGHPIVITSGYRTAKENKVKGGVADSAHVKGMAVDIKVPESQHLRERLAWACGRAGFSRMGLYDFHAHLDTENDTKPSPAFWTGKSK